jgi:hypothetical protein
MRQNFNFKEIAKFVRRSVLYLAETLHFLTDYIDNVNCMKLAFLVYKIVTSIQKDTTRNSLYWEILKTGNNEERWDYMNQNEANLIRPFG